MKKARLIILSISILALIVVLYAYADSTGMLPVSKKVSGSKASNVENSPQSSSQVVNPALKSGGIDFSNMKASVALNVPFIDQNPELPTGCEVTALAELLHFYGFEIDKEELAKNYLPIKQNPETGAFIEFYLGSPWEVNGSGCFAPAISICANSFLKDQESKLVASSISYSDPAAIFNELSQGRPVIVWTSYNYAEREVTYKDVPLLDGNYFPWPSNEHCVVLCGYDSNKGTVTFADPTYGMVEHSMEDFVYFYQMYFYQAVIIK